MLGKRLAEARRRAGLLQVDLAVAMGERYDQKMVSHVERGRSGLRLEGLVNAAKELKVSTDYLLGLTDEPTPAAQRGSPFPGTGSTSANVTRETRGGYEASGDSDARRPVEVLEVASAAGAGAEVLDETPVGLLWFRSDWLERHSIDPARATLITVSGESMEPTLADGCSILVDRGRRDPQGGRIYVIRTEEGLVVKRLGLDEGGNWEVVSDNPAWLPMPLRYGSEIIGEVRWVGRTL